MQPAKQIEQAIVQIVENNPGCTQASIFSEIRSAFGVSCAHIFKSMKERGIIKTHQNGNVYMVED